MLLLKTEPCSYQGSLNAQFRFIALVGLFTLHFICGLYDKSSQSHMNYNTTVQPEVALREIPLVSDLGPHMKVAQTRSDHWTDRIACDWCFLRCSAWNPEIHRIGDTFVQNNFAALAYSVTRPITASYHHNISPPPRRSSSLKKPPSMSDRSLSKSSPLLNRLISVFKPNR